MKALKITNPDWLPMIAPRIQEYVSKIKSKTTTYESYYTHFANIVQFGGDMAEFWVIFDDTDIPVAFGQFSMAGNPAIGTVSFNEVYSWAKDKEPFRLLVREFINYGQKRRATKFQGAANNRKLFNHFKEVGKQEGVILEQSKHVFFVGRKVRKDESIQQDSN